MPETRITPDGVIFWVYVQPKASANAISGLHENALKIRLTAPPVDNAANKMCVKFLSRQLKIPASRMEIIGGHASRKKKVLVRFAEDEGPQTAGQTITRQVKALAGKK